MGGRGATSTNRDSSDVANAAKHAGKLLNCGFASGLVQAFVFNPWDRALYLSIMNERPFLRLENFRNPMSGVFQTVLQRAISGGMYFPLEELSLEILSAWFGKKNPFITFAAGTIAGVANGVVMNPFTRIKYHYWGKVDPGKENFISTTREIFKMGGVSQFFVGTMATVQRDLIFGGTFAILRHEVLPRFRGPLDPDDKHTGFIVNAVSAMAATILSSPLNYVRNIHYATPPSDSPKTSSVILRELWLESLKEKSMWDRAHFLQVRLRIGWGTARVGCGMAVGAKIYELCSNSPYI